MLDVPPDYVAELYRQIAFVSGVLGGFSVAFVGALLASAPERRAVTWAIGCAAAAAILFVVSTLGAVFLLLDVMRLGIESFDVALWPAPALRSRFITGIANLVGIYALVVAIGLSGWARSRQTGRVTATIAAVGLVLLTLVVAGSAL